MSDLLHGNVRTFAHMGGWGIQHGTGIIQKTYPCETPCLRPCTG